MISIGQLILILNISAFILMGIDKGLSKKKGRGRIPEFIFFLLAFFSCAIGIGFGMIIFNHKTSKLSFRIYVPAFIFLNYYLSMDSFMVLKAVLNWVLAAIG